jgi:DNA repair protein RadC
MSIRDWPENERPRGELLENGAGALSDAELLAILLRRGAAGHSTVDLAGKVRRNSNSQRKLIAADRRRFRAEAGLGGTRFAELAFEIARRQLSKALPAGPGLSAAPAR